MNHTMLSAELIAEAVSRTHESPSPGPRLQGAPGTIYTLADLVVDRFARPSRKGSTVTVKPFSMLNGYYLRSVTVRTNVPMTGDVLDWLSCAALTKIPEGYECQFVVSDERPQPQTD